MLQPKSTDGMSASAGKVIAEVKRQKNEAKDHLHSLSKRGRLIKEHFRKQFPPLSLAQLSLHVPFKTRSAKKFITLIGALMAREWKREKERREWPKEAICSPSQSLFLSD